MAEEKVKQHFVPCCYLANFGISGNDKRATEIYAYDTNTFKTQRASVESFAFSNNFYNLDIPNNQKGLEDFFCIVEGDYSEILKQVLSLPRNKTINREQKEALAAQFAIQHIRTKAHRDQYWEILKALAQIVPEAKLKHVYKSKIEYLRSLHVKEIMSFDSIRFFANLLLDRIWIIWRNETETPFYTSDNPVCTIFHGDPRSSIAAPDVEIYIPLSPSMAVSAYDKSIIEADRDRAVAGICDKRIIDGFNLYLLPYCTQFVFSNEESFDSYKLKD